MTPNEWEELFGLWAKGPSATESERAENAARLIREAIRDHAPLRRRSIEVFPQGSYANRTNVRMDSDVDVCVLCTDTFYFDTAHAPGATRESLGIEPASYDFDEYKREIHDALVAKFGPKGVTPGNKAFDVHENTYRVAADVVPTFEGRDYIADGYGGHTTRKGTVLRNDANGALIWNYPRQHYAEGVAKHAATARQFKKKARILKRLRHFLIEEGVDVGTGTSSFLVESLVYNCPDSCFAHPTHAADVESVLIEIQRQLQGEPADLKMLEVNGIKYLFHASQPWSVTDARKCASAMAKRLGI